MCPALLHQALKSNTRFEMVKANGGHTAWADEQTQIVPIAKGIKQKPIGRSAHRNALSFVCDPFLRSLFFSLDPFLGKIGLRRYF